MKGKLEAAGISVRAVSFPEGIKDANELLVSRNGDAGAGLPPAPRCGRAAAGPEAEPSQSHSMSSLRARRRAPSGLQLVRDGVAYQRARPLAPHGAPAGDGEGDEGRGLPRGHDRPLRLEEPRRVCASAPARRSASKGRGRGGAPGLVVEAEKTAEAAERGEASPRRAMSESRACGSARFLKRQDLLDQAAREIDALGYVGEETNKRLLYLVAVSRKLEDPLSAIVLGQSGAGKSGLTEVIERLCPPEDVVLLTRLTPQSLYYTEPGFLDRKLVIVEERYGSMEADYSIRVLQSRKKLIAAAPVKDPQTGNMRTKVFTVEARAAFIEATTASW